MPSACTIPNGCCSRCGARARDPASSRRSPGTTPSTSWPRPSLRAEQRHGSEAVWPYYYAGTMGLVMRDGINRLRHAKKYSGFHSTICVNPALTGLCRWRRPARRSRSARDGEVRPDRDLGHQRGQHPGQRDDPRDPRPQGARRQDRGSRRLHERHHGAGRPAGADPSRHRRRARLRRNALPVSRRHAPTGIISRATPMRRTNWKRICARAMPAWASRITGCDVATIEAFARLIGERKRAFFRLGYGFSRSRNGAANMHAASCIAAVTRRLAARRAAAPSTTIGAIYHWNKTHDRRPRRRRSIDPRARSVAHRRDPVRRAGCARRRSAGHGDLHPEHQSALGRARSGAGEARVCARRSVRLRPRAVHDRDRAHGRHRAAGDHVPRARRLLSRRRASIHSLGPKLIEPPGECRNNHEVDCALARAPRRAASGLRHVAAGIDRLDVAQIGLGNARGTRSGSAGSIASRISPPPTMSMASPGRTASSASSPTGKTSRSAARCGPGPSRTMPALPDHWDVIEEADAVHPFRLATSPARNFLNSTFNETPTSRAREGRPEVMIHPDDAAATGIADGDAVVIGQQARRSAPSRACFGGVQARRADRRIDLAEQCLSRRTRHQHADRRRSDRAIRRSRVPRQQGVDQAGPLMCAEGARVRELNAMRDVCS